MTDEVIATVVDAVALVRDAVVLLDSVTDTATPDSMPDTLSIATANGAVILVRVTLHTPSAKEA